MTQETPQPAARSSPRRAWGGMLLFAAALALLLYTQRPAPEPAGWGSDLAAATAQAAAENRLIVVAFNLPGCPPCDQMKRTTLIDPAVVEALRGFIPVKLDAAANREPADRYVVYAAPTYIVINAGGDLLGRTEGWLPADRFLDFLNRARKKAAQAAGA